MNATYDLERWRIPPLDLAFLVSQILSSEVDWDLSRYRKRYATKIRVDHMEHKSKKATDSLANRTECWYLADD